MHLSSGTNNQYYERNHIPQAKKLGAGGNPAPFSATPPFIPAEKLRTDPAHIKNVELSAAPSDGMMGWRMSVLIKICGITNLADALLSVEAGADILGFVFYERSPRYLPLRVAGEIIRRLPASVVKAGVFVNADKERINCVVGECGLDLLQFHGEERPEHCLRFGLRTMKAFRIRGPESLRILPDYGTDAWLLDAYTPGARGGTGERFDWDLAVEAGSWGRPIFLAGGLTPSNVATAIRQVHPYGVDVSSGVEKAPGRKDAAKVKTFIAAARGPGRNHTGDPRLRGNEAMIEDKPQGH